MLNSCYASGVDSSNVLYSSKDSWGGVGVEIQLLQLFWSRTCLKSCWLLVQKSAKMYLIKKFASHWLPEAKVEFLSDLWADGIDILATKVVIKHQVLKLNTGVHQGCWCLYQAVYWGTLKTWPRPLAGPMAYIWPTYWPTCWPTSNFRSWFRKSYL